VLLRRPVREISTDTFDSGSSRDAA